MLSAEHFDVKFTSREVSAWGGLALLKKMMDGMGVFQAIQSWQLPIISGFFYASYFFGSACKIEANSTLTHSCRVKRHLISTRNHEHGSPAETKPDSTICAQGVKWVSSF
jgi:hypothetical protein